MTNRTTPKLWIGQRYGADLRECTLIGAGEQSTFFATDEQAREFAAEMNATIYEAASYDAEPDARTDPWLELATSGASQRFNRADDEGSDGKQ